MVYGRVPHWACQARDLIEVVGFGSSSSLVRPAARRVVGPGSCTVPGAINWYCWECPRIADAAISGGGAERLLRPW